METQAIEVTSEGKQQVSSAKKLLIAIDLPGCIEQLRTGLKWDKSDRNVFTVYRSNLLRILLIALHKGAWLVWYPRKRMLSIQVLEGLLVINTPNQSIELKRGELLVLQDDIRHQVMASEETVFLLTLHS